MRVPARRLRVMALAFAFVLASASQPRAAATGPLQASFLTAAQEFSVPVAVLMGLSYVETGWRHHEGTPSFANGYGIMHLQDNPRNDGLRVAAQLVGLPVELVQTDRDQNIRAGAALLAHGYREAYPDDAAMRLAPDSSRWYPAVAAYLRTDKAAAMRN